MKRKNRKIKEEEYKQKYSHIPIDYNERLEWMYDNYKINDRKAREILDKRYAMISDLYYKDINIVLLEEPEGTPRPRFRLINRHNLVNEAINNGQFVHVYSLNAKEDSIHMKRLIDQELVQLQELIWTPCIVEYNIYQKIPTVFNTTDTFLAELGLIRPITKPDWDNIGKKYSDMFNHNVWLDDTLVISGTLNKFYSILPRVEIKLRYLNTLYNKYQYNTIMKRTDQEISYFKGEKTK